MTPRDAYFALLAGEPLDHTPFFPDISPWYERHRTAAGLPQVFSAGAFIPDGDPIHDQPGTMPEPWRNMSYVDIYRQYNGGLPAHLYDWASSRYDRCDVETVTEGPMRTMTYRTPAGELTKRYQLADDGSWAPIELPAQPLDDLEILKLIAEDHAIPDFNIGTPNQWSRS